MVSAIGFKLNSPDMITGFGYRRHRIHRARGDGVGFDNTLMQIEDILGDKTTNNLQLFKLGKMLFGDRFVNVFCSDDKITLNNNEMCILNTDPHYKPGLHWLALYKYGNVYYVFDSFGRIIHILSKLFKNKKWFEVEHNRVEFYKSANCVELMTFFIIFDQYKLNCKGVI